MDRWLFDDHHTIAQLAARRGRSLDAVTEELLAASRTRVGAEQLEALRRRTTLVLTHGHLAQHVLFHLFHGPLDYGGDVPRVFGVGRTTFRSLRERGLTPLAVGALGGRSPRAVRLGMLRVLRADARRGVRLGETPPGQGPLTARRQIGKLDCWLRTPLAKYDPRNPAGDPWSGHGPHGHRERPGVRGDSKRARVRRDGRSCWL